MFILATPHGGVLTTASSGFLPVFGEISLGEIEFLFGHRSLDAPSTRDLMRS